MYAYIIRRILILIPMLLVITLLIYLGIELMPGDAVSFMIGPECSKYTHRKIRRVKGIVGFK